jgi:hypothetical protein
MVQQITTERGDMIYYLPMDKLLQKKGVMTPECGDKA